MKFKRTTLILIIISAVFMVSCTKSAQLDLTEPINPSVNEEHSKETQEQQTQQELLQSPPECINKKETDANLPETCKIWFSIQKKQPIQPVQQPQQASQLIYSEEKLLFTNGYADPSVIKMPDSTYLMYLNKFNQQGSGYFVLTSKDAVEWKEKTGIIFPGVGTGRAFLTEKGVRFYYPTTTPRNPSDPSSNIISSFAGDGINFEKEEDVRIQPRQGYYVSGPAVIRLKDGTYRMFFDESDIQSGNVQKAEIYGASSSDSINWKRDEKPTVVAEDNVETGNIKQVLHPFVVEWQNGYLMLYNSHIRVFAAYSDDGFRWQKLGNTGLTGADVNIIALPDGSFRVYFGRFSETTSGEVYTAILKIKDESKEIITKSVEGNCIGFLTGIPGEAKTIILTDGGWARPHPGPFVWDHIEQEKGKFNFKATDDWVKNAQDNNIALLATIWPYAGWDQAGCHINECEVSAQDQFSQPLQLLPKSRCAPCNANDYKKFLSSLVERYDGDGIDDMPNLKIPIKYWEILNEPEMNELGLTFYKGTGQEYVEILKNSNESIKATCADCKIVQGGAAGIRPEMLSYWEKIFDLGGANYFDIANIHYINSGDLSTLNVKDFKKLMQKKNIVKPIWVTEVEYSSESQVEESVDGALNEGASKIFFTRFKVGQSGPTRPGEYSKIYKKMPLKCK